MSPPSGALRYEPVHLLRAPGNTLRCGGGNRGGGPLQFMPFFLASLGLTLSFGTALGVLNLLRLTGTWGYLARPSVWAHGYAQTFGFIALFIMGFAYHAVPRFAGTPLAMARSVWWAFGLQVAGVLSVVFGLVFDPAHLRPYWIVGTGALLVASLLFASAMLGTLLPRRAPWEPFAPWVAAAALWFVVAASLAAIAALEGDLAWHHVLWPAFLLGGAGSWILGVGRRLFPLSLGWRPRPGIDRVAFLLYQLAVAAQCVGSWPSVSLGAVRAVDAVALPAATLLVARALGFGWRSSSPGTRSDLPYGRYVLAAWTWLFAAVVVSSAATAIAVSGHTFVSVTMIDFVRHTLSVGFVTQMIVGLGCRFIPVFAGTWLWSPRAHAATFWLLNAGVILRAPEAVIGFGHWAGAWPLLGLAGPPVLAAVALFAANIVVTVHAAGRRRYTRSSVAYRRLSRLLELRGVREILEGAGFSPILNAPIVGPLLARVLTLEHACRLLEIPADEIVARLGATERLTRRSGPATDVRRGFS